MKIAFTKGHGESIFPDDNIKNFNQLFGFLEVIKANCFSLLSADLTFESLKDCDLVVIGDPTKNISPSEIKVLQKYMTRGGNIFAICRWGGDKKNGTNIGKLFPEIQPNNDEVYDPNIEDDNYKNFIIAMNIDINQSKFHFSGRILYDSGCTFTIKNDVDYKFQPDRSILAIDRPRDGYEINRKKMIAGKPAGPIFVHKTVGVGSITYWGARWSFSDLLWEEYDNSSFFRTIVTSLVGKRAILENIKYRMSQPQRHRLLHGYPMSAALRKIKRAEEPFSELDMDHEKPLAIGIIPHPLCSTSKKQCGYCTFPYEKFNENKERASVSAVLSEINAVIEKVPELSERGVSSMYFGGGTANRTSSSSFLKLCDAISDKFIITADTEITLEGAPNLFISNCGLLDILLDHFPMARLRISMGIQTFDQKILALSGRSVMNKEKSVEKATKIARDLGFNVSGDFLFNLPGQQSYKKISADLQRVVDIGIEHISWYHLVAYEKLDTPWSRDETIFKSLPNQEQSLKNMEKLHLALHDNGYEPITVTDF